MSQDNEQYSVIEIEIPGSASGERLDKYLGQNQDLNITRSRVQKLIESGLVSVDGVPAAHNHRLKGGEIVVLKVPPARKSDAVPEDIPLDVVFEDDHLLVVNKPPGMVTHPGAGNYTGTLVNALLHYSSKLSGIQGIERAGIIHRLDKNTSGLIIVARNDEVHVALQRELKEQRIRKTYQALVCGHMKDDSGVIDLPIGRSLKDRKKMTVTTRLSRRAVTEYKLVDRYRLYDLLEINLKTGRTHQIRVHFGHTGHPVFGDPQYGGREKWHRGIFSPDRMLAGKALGMINRQALHARRLEFTHPITGKKLILETDLPDDFKNLLEFLDADGR